MSTQTGATRSLPGPWAAPIGRCTSGGGAAGRGRRCRTRLGPGDHAFFPSAVRAQVTALACTLPRDSGKPLSRWSTSELARAVVRRGIVRRISGATIQRWLQADRINPWRYHSWQRPTDPRFLERAIPILTLYERAQRLARTGHLIVCADEKTSIQARQPCGRTTPARPGRPLHLPDRYQRRGAYGDDAIARVLNKLGGGPGKANGGARSAWRRRAGITRFRARRAPRRIRRS
jgi:hypothetical protein